MKANRRTDTSPERQVRSALHRLGYRFRKDLLLRVGGLRVHADIAFTSCRVAIFVDGCFWHGCPEHGLTPRSNAAYWGPKLEGNIRRDALVTEALTKNGWKVVRLWEHVQLADATMEIVRWLPKRGQFGEMDGLI